MKVKEVKKIKDPMERFLYFVQERRVVQYRKEIGLPKPWTDDERLQQYKFCNIRRMDDRVSQWLLDNWYQEDHPNILTACILARQLNNVDSLAEVGFPITWNPSRVEKILNNRVERGLKNFAAAYMITGTLGGTKIEQVVHKVVTPIHRDRKKLTMNTTSMEELWRKLLPYAGFSTFIAGQVVADLRWVLHGSWYDKVNWAPVGPGSRRGMNRVLGQDLKTTMDQNRFEILLAPIIERVRNLSGNASWFSQLEAMDIQNCLCEFDKSERLLWGKGRPKQKYPGL